MLELLQEHASSDVEYRISVGAIKHNISQMRGLLGSKTRLMVMVKASAYGTDDETLAKFLEQCDIDILGVATLEEALVLKKKGILQSIFVMNILPEQAETAVASGVEIGASNGQMIEAVAKAAVSLEKKGILHLHIDTGMSRFGCRPEEAAGFASRIAQDPNLLLEGIMTHFSCSDIPNEDPFTQKQIDLFSSTIFNLQNSGLKAKWYHTANSAAAARFSIPLCNMVRLGLIIYGILPSSKIEAPINLRPALSLKTRLVGINECKKGDSIGYQRLYKIKEGHRRIGILPIGYFDGLQRHYSGKLEVLLRGKKAPLIGAVCMDHSMIDITHIPEAGLGDPITIFGSDGFGNTISPLEIADRGGTIVHEFITCLGPRIQRIFD